MTQITVFDFMNWLDSNNKAGNGKTEEAGDTTRVETLQRDRSCYKETYEKMGSIGLMDIKYGTIPTDPKKKTDHILRVIGRAMRQMVCGSDNPEETIKGIFSPSGSGVKVSRLDGNANNGVAIACSALGTKSCYEVVFEALDHVVYGAFGGRRIKSDGYYHMRNTPWENVHVVDMERLLARAFLITGIREIYEMEDMPLVTEIINGFKKESDGTAFMDIEAGGENMIANCIFMDRKLSTSTRIYEADRKIVYRYSSELLCAVLELYNEVKYENEYRKKEAVSVATAFMTKKNIPKYMEKAMEETSFLRYFKYVEFDEDVDLDSIGTIEKEFMDLGGKWIPSRRFPAVTLRFRKLGKHKAAGLYYPMLHTMCVDIRHPSSFVHEYFHMLDDQFGDLSLDTDFSGIVNEYKKAFGSQKVTAEVESVLKGRGKYNIQYYFRRTEIFARCGEIYLSRIMGVESSLMKKKEDFDFAYPESEELDRLVKEYYESLMSSLIPAKRSAV